MSTMLGADPEELDRVARQIGAWASLLAQYRLTLNVQLHSAPWYGQEADRFRSEWNSRLAPSLAATSDALHTASAALRHNAEQQRNASGVGAGHGPGQSADGGAGLRQLFERFDTPLAIGNGLALIAHTLVKQKVGRVAIKDFRTFVKQFKKFERHLPPPLERFTRVFQIGTVLNEASKTLYDLEHGDISPSQVFHLGWDAAAFVPVVGEMEGAWDVGTGIGTFLANTFHTSDGLWNLASSGQGDIYHDPAAADRLVKRYSGAFGIVHFGKDVTDGFASKAGRWLSSL